MPRFVLLYHDCPPGYERPSHWDLMLEDGDALATWALFALPRAWSSVHRHTLEKFPTCPLLGETETVNAERLARHRIDYLKYEGAIANDRGHVARVAQGEYHFTFQSDGCVRFTCKAGLPAGEIVITRCREGRAWELTSSS
jgi:hypothetical protein